MHASMKAFVEGELIVAGFLLGIAAIAIVIGTWRMRVEERKKRQQSGTSAEKN